MGDTLNYFHGEGVKGQKVETDFPGVPLKCFHLLCLYFKQ